MRNPKWTVAAAILFVLCMIINSQPAAAITLNQHIMVRVNQHSGTTDNAIAAYANIGQDRIQQPIATAKNGTAASYYIVMRVKEVDRHTAMIAATGIYGAPRKAPIRNNNVHNMNASAKANGIMGAPRKKPPLT